MLSQFKVFVKMLLAILKHFYEQNDHMICLTGQTEYDYVMNTLK